MADVIKYAFSFDCTDSAGDIFVTTSSVNWCWWDTSTRRLGIFGPSTTPSSPSRVLEVANYGTTSTVLFHNDLNNSSARVLDLQFGGISTPAVTNWFLQFQDSGGGRDGGVRGTGTGNVFYETFSGGHNSQVPGSSVEDGVFNDGTQDWEVGMILCATGDMMTNGEEVTEQPQTELAASANDPKVVGVYNSAEEDSNLRGSDPDHPVIGFTALGHCKVLVTDKNGEVDCGDLVTSSTIPGYGQKQDDDIIRSCTVGKVFEQVDWDNITETIDEDGQSYKKALVTCYIYCG